MSLESFINSYFHIINAPEHRLEETELFVLADIHILPFTIINNLFIEMFAQEASKVYVESLPEGKVCSQEASDLTLFLKKRKYAVIGWDPRGAKFDKIEASLTDKARTMQCILREHSKKYFETNAEDFAKEFNSIMEDLCGEMASNNSDVLERIMRLGIEEYSETNQGLERTIKKHNNEENSFDFLIVGGGHIKNLIKQERAQEVFGFPPLDIAAIATGKKVTVLYSKLFQGLIPQEVNPEKMKHFMLQSEKFLTPYQTLAEYLYEESYNSSQQK